MSAASMRLFAKAKKCMMNKTTMKKKQTIGLYVACLAFSCVAIEPPAKPPARMPYSPAELKEYVACEAAAAVKVRQLQDVSRKASNAYKSALEKKMDANVTAERKRLAVQATAEAAAYFEVLDGYRTLVKSFTGQRPAGASLKGGVNLVMPQPTDAEARRKAFEARNTPREIEILAKRFFNAIDPENRKHADGAGKRKALDLYQAGRYQDALDAFRDYFFDRLVNPEKYGLPVTVFIGDDRPVLGTPVIPEGWVADAMRGVATMVNPKGEEILLKINVGEPGSVNWAYIPEGARTDEQVIQWTHIMRQFHYIDWTSGNTSDGLRCWLLDAYQSTGEAKYLVRWCAYMDDWGMNLQHDLNAIQAQDVSGEPFSGKAFYPWNLRAYPTLIPRMMLQHLGRLRTLEQMVPGTVKQYPSATLARVLLTALDEYLAPQILQARWSRFNWNIMGMGMNLRCSLLLADFKAGQWDSRETARVLQNYMTFSVMPDGGYIEYTDEGHQGVWNERISEFYTLCEATKPAWYDPIVAKEVKESLTRNADYLIRHLKQDGYRHREKIRDNKHVFVGHKIWAYGNGSLDVMSPWMTDEGETGRIVDTVHRGITTNQPRHLSDTLPNLGEFMLRGGWKPSDSMFYMHCGRTPNSNAGEDCTSYKLHNYGRFLAIGQPIYVDGRTQNAHYTCVDNTGGKTEFLVWVDGLATKGRWHTSDAFDVAEGMYEGVYEERKTGRPYWSPFQMGGEMKMDYRLRSMGKPAVTDVECHTRQVIYIRNPEAWVVIDRITSKAAHQYEAPFEILTPLKKSVFEKKAWTDKEGVSVDPEAKVVRSINADYPNVTLRHFAPNGFTYEFDPKNGLPFDKKGKKEIEAAESIFGRAQPEVQDALAFYRRLLVKWNGTGNQVLVTFLTTTPAGVKEDAWKVVSTRKDPNPGDEAHFHAVAPDGTEVNLYAFVAPNRIDKGSEGYFADTILETKTKSGDVRKIVLGPFASEERLNGKVVRAIYAPIQPVTFEAPASVFTESVTVKLACSTPEVTLRYTLDGSEPTAHSAIYTTPLKLIHTTELRALATREGVREVNYSHDPGYICFPTRAVYTRQTLAPVVRVADRAFVWHYTEGQPFALISQSAFFQPQKIGKTDKLFDLSMRTPGKTFTVSYEGAVQATQDGVYTFHAPREFIYPEQDPGYDLRIFVDGQEWWPSYRRHDLGNWSLALAKGTHLLKVIFTDMRATPYKHETWQNFVNPALIWKGTTPIVKVTCPDGKQVDLATWGGEKK